MIQKHECFNAAYRLVENYLIGLLSDPIAIMTPGPTPVDSEKPRSALIRESLVKDLDHLSSLAGREDWRQNISSIVDFGVDFSYAEVTFGSVGTRALKDILSWMPTDQLKFVSIKLLLLHLHLLLEEYNSTAGDLGKQQEIMLRSIEPLQRCCLSPLLLVDTIFVSASITNALNRRSVHRSPDSAAHQC